MIWSLNEIFINLIQVSCPDIQKTPLVVPPIRHDIMLTEPKILEND